VLPGWRVPSRERLALRDYSLVIPTRNRGADVERLLDTLLAIPDPPAEVVIVDGDPARNIEARLRAWIAQAAAPFALVYVAGPPELTRRRNAGVDITAHDFIFFLDPDAIPLPGYFRETRRVFEIDHWNCVGGVAGIVVNDERPRRLSPFSGLRRADVLPACASAWRRDLFNDYRFSCYFGDHPEGEDVELCLRAGKSWTLLYCGDARIQRTSTATAAAPGFGAGRAHIRNRYFVWKRHFARPGARSMARFWCGAALTAAMDVAGFRVARAAGVLAGIADCLTRPPRFVEPPAGREYVLAGETPRAASLRHQPS
jgi:GT2 family glycosyltransferase